MSYTYLITRHLLGRQPEYAYPSNLPGRKDGVHTPLGIDLEPPFPTARLFYTDLRDGFLFAHWVDARLNRDAEAHAAALDGHDVGVTE